MEQDDFGTERTLDFIRSNLPPGTSHVLEVGSGRGRLTAALRRLGLNVRAIDRSPKAVALAAEEGVQVEEADLVRFESPRPFDAVVFSMSAHHVSPLGEGLDRVAKVLRSGGAVVLEEYAVEEVDEKTARWYYQTLALLNSMGLFEREEDPSTALGNALGTWRREHSTHGDHHFNSGHELLAETGRRFEIVTKEWGPYFFRYLAARIAPYPTRAELGKRLYSLEKALIAQGFIKPIGLRVVARQVSR